MSSFSPGASLGPYKVVEPLGAGGMGEVFKARDTRLDRIVALKILPQHLSSSEELRQRFEREARAISKLSHPHVCQLYDIGHESGISYLVMEYLEGETLAQRLAKGPIPLAETLKYGAQIAEALEAAHREGILHRDMKPGNVVLTKAGAKLLDFGLAKNASMAGNAEDLSASPTLTSPLTTEGTIVGTYQYIAPEVLEGHAADKRSDIFGFGAMLYEMITGQKAFHGKTQASVIAAVLEREPPRASALTPTTPARLDELVRAC
ncbi:MAG: serine/threonine protein kinase, partial [Gemmatimonadetes bacterium]|nr:serine/threonine protein kinase [Gemmatimonadota bacterium]